MPSSHLILYRPLLLLPPIPPKVVPELVAETFSVDNIRRELEALLPGGHKREQMLADYDEVFRRLGDSHAPERAADIMIEKLRH